MPTPDRAAHLVDDEWVQFRKQEIADQEALDRKHGRMAQVEMVFNVVAEWDYVPFLERQRAIVRRILAERRNVRRKLSGLTEKELRRQHAIRLVEVIAFENATQADWCRRMGVKSYQASRLLASFCNTEPGLEAALNSLTACLKTVFSEEVQQRRMLLPKVKEPSVTLVPGFDPDQFPNTADWLTCSSSCGARRSGGTWLPLTLISDDQEFEPHDLHKPEKWANSAHDLSGEFWSRVEQQADAPPDRFWPRTVFNDWNGKIALAKWPARHTIAKRVKLKSGRHEVWRVARAASPVRHIDFHQNWPQHLATSPHPDAGVVVLPAM